MQVVKLGVYTTVNPTEGIIEVMDDVEDLVDSKFEKMDDQDDIHKAYEKLYKISENMKNYIGWPPRSWVIWNLIKRSFPQILMNPIRPLEFYGLRKISWLRRPRNLRQLFQVKA